MATTSFVGGRLRVTHSDAYRASTSRTRSIDLATAGDVDALLVDTLRRNGFDAVHRVVVGPDRAKSRDVGAGQGTSVSLALDVATDEDAVVLLEHEGCYTWLRPRHETSRDPQVIGRVAVFEFVVPPAGAATRDLGGLAAGAARATVLSYASPLLSKAAIRALELFVDPGLVHIAGVDPAEWRHVGSLADTGLSPDRNSRVLLLVHGTFDSTVGAFGALAATEAGRDFLTQALGDYDAVIGFDHKTLSVDPLENARELAAVLTPFRGRQVTLDVVCHSRGGLTARSFVESVLPGLAWRGKVDRAVFVGATNAGTHFADETRWADLADVYTNLVAANARAIAALPGGAPIAALVVGAVRGIGALVRWLASYATDPDSVPGIAAMVPDGPFVTEHQPGPAWPAPFGDALVRRVVGLRGDRRRPPTGAPGGRGRAARRRCRRPGHHRTERPRRRRRVDERHRPRARGRVRAQRPCPAGELDRLPHELLLPGVRLPGSGGVARPAGRPPRGGGAGGSGPGHRR